jgi:prepilin-type N-terminal cleavage/methylation domain-containing protein
MRRRSAFTLIELMIVMAIIAIISAICIPNLLEARKAANEGQAAANLKAYLNAQEQYAANNYSFVPANGGDGTARTVKRYAAMHTFLGGAGAHVDGAGEPIRLLKAPVAEAVDAASSYSGYFYSDIVTHAGAATDYLRQHGLCATPAFYSIAPTTHFIVNAEGVVYQKDTGNGGDGAEVTDWPADPVAAGWIPR